MYKMLPRSARYDKAHATVRNGVVPANALPVFAWRRNNGTHPNTTETE